MVMPTVAVPVEYDDSEPACFFPDVDDSDMIVWTEGLCVDGILCGRWKADNWISEVGER